MDLILDNDIINDALNHFRNNKFEIEYIEELNEYKIFDYFASFQYTEEELVLQYLRETKRRYKNKIYW